MEAYRSWHPSASLSLNMITRDISPEGAFGVAPRSSASGILQIAMAAEGPRCCPEYDATFQYKWNGNRFVLMGKPQRKKFAQE